MNFQAHLSNLRAKPEPTRKRIAFWSSFGITAIIFAFWLASFTSSIAAPSQSAVASVAEKASTPGSSLIAGVGAVFTDIRDMIFTPKKVTYKSIEILPGK